MSNLEDTLRGTMGKDGVIALNLFLNKDGKFQANLGMAERGAYAISRSADPVKAIQGAFEQHAKGSKPTLDDQFEDLLG